MTKSEYQRLIKIENEINKIAKEELLLEYHPIEYDICPPEPMLEIMSYSGIPNNISNWKFGRNYERQRTLYEYNNHLPFEVIIYGDPMRAYLMKTNTLGVQMLVMAHCVGHSAVMTVNNNFKETRYDIIQTMSEASRRFIKYEKMYGIDEVEKTVDAGHALQLHSSPIEDEHEKDKRNRIFEQMKKDAHSVPKSQYNDILGSNKEKITKDIDLYNQELWKKLCTKTPVEPTEDILRYIIDNSDILQDWQRDVLEILRFEGQYLRPIIKTKHLNEGFAVYVHIYIMNKLIKKGLLTTEEIAQYQYANSLVVAYNPYQLNPYLIGYKIWCDIKERWDKGRHGQEYENCTNAYEKENWDTKDNAGLEKMHSVLRTYNDWFFMQEFLTAKLVKDLKIYLYEEKEGYSSIDYTVTKHRANEIRDLVVMAFANSFIPRIVVSNGNYNDKKEIELTHMYQGIPLDEEYRDKTLAHIEYLWGKKAHMKINKDN